VPIILFDSHQQVAAVVHAGWRGTVKNIVGHVLSIIREKFHVEMSGVKAVIGPSISVNAFEVGQEVFDTFSVAGFPMDEISMKKEGRWHIDLWKANQWQMLNNGINKNNIHVSGICTYDNVENFFSARRLTINSGRILSGIMIKDEE
jgi:YfiH family protein